MGGCCHSRRNAGQGSTGGDGTGDVRGTGTRLGQKSVGRGVRFPGEHGLADAVGLAGAPHRAAPSEAEARSADRIGSGRSCGLHCVPVGFGAKAVGASGSALRGESVRGSRVCAKRDRCGRRAACGHVPILKLFRQLLEGHGSRRWAVRGDQRAPGLARLRRSQGDDRRRAEFDEERERRAGSGHAPEEEGKQWSFGGNATEPVVPKPIPPNKRTRFRRDNGFAIGGSVVRWPGWPESWLGQTFPKGSSLSREAPPTRRALVSLWCRRLGPPASSPLG